MATSPKSTTLQWISKKKVSEITEIFVDTMRAHRFHRCGFTYAKIGRSVRYALSYIENFMRARTIRPEA